METKKEYDTLIVGAGPVGLSVACELVRQGLASQVLLVDSLKEQLLQTKASILWPRSLEVLAAFTGIVTAAEAYGLRLTNVVFRGDQNAFLTRINLAKHFDSAYHYGVLLEQWYTEKLLAEYCTANNLHINRSTAFVSFKYVENNSGYPIEAILNTPSGRVTVHVKYLIGCDGTKSIVRKAIGLSFNGQVLPGTFYSAHFTTKHQVLEIDNTALSIYLTSKGMGFITPMPGDSTHEVSYMSGVSLTDEEAKKYATGKFNSHGQAILADIPLLDGQILLRERLQANIIIDKIRWQTHFRVNERLVGGYSDGKHVFLAGDACHAHSPAGGQGQNTGIQEAINLGWKLAMVLKNQASPALLESYENERLAIGKNLIDFTTRASTMTTLENCMLRFIRDKVIGLATSQSFVCDIIAQTIGETIHNYRNVEFNSEHWEKPPLIPHFFRRRNQNILRLFANRLHAGDRISIHMFPTVETSFWIQTTGFKLVFFQGCCHSKLPTFDLSLASLHELGEHLIKSTQGAITAYIVIPASECETSTVGVRGQCLFLIRPDGHVGLRSEPASANIVLAYLRDRVGWLKFDESALSLAVKPFNPLKHDWMHGVFFTAVIGGVIAWYLNK
ncbi:hypothetical protein HK100_011970 [Physocladia obscura]|uniref:FAD-binding domain-containing protein n=1 Tax=Physocladia obscura TaxID=109957 RepID=A0AAD5T0G7_9FUNG|nr:hypothetical protein HK100_011970 [Physocladia obscura]